MKEGNVIRGGKRIPFTQVNTDLLKNAELSMRAKYIHCLLMSFPDNWSYNKKHLMRYIKEGRDAFNNAWAELVEAGYILEVRRVDDKHRFAFTDYVVYTEAYNGEGQKPLETLENTPRTEIPYTESPSTENPLHSNIEVSNTNFSLPKGILSETPKQVFERTVSTIIDTLNQETKRAYRKDTRETLRLLKRVLTNYTVDEVQQVIRHKAKKWLNDPKMSEFLRPETLFGSKFDSYLQDAIHSPVVETIEIANIIPHYQDQKAIEVYNKLKAKGFRNCTPKEVEWCFDFQRTDNNRQETFSRPELLVNRTDPQTYGDIDDADEKKRQQDAQKRFQFTMPPVR